MNRGSLWVVTVVVAAWIAFLLGYAMSAHTGSQSATAPQPISGGYGKLPAKKPEAPVGGEIKGGR